MADVTAPSEIAALRTPTQSKGLGWQIIFGLANVVIGFGNVVFYTVLLPARIASLASLQNTTNTFIVISAMGAGTSVLTNPLVGACSDRTTSPWGRRKPWLVSGTLLFAATMVLVALAPSIAFLAIASVLLQMAVNMVLAALTAVIPDQIPLAQRAQVSALAGMAPLFGGVIGQLLVAQVMKNTDLSFYVLTAMAVLVLAVFILVFHDVRLDRGVMPPFRWRDLLASFWVNPITNPDFAYVWGARCLMFLGFTTVVNYLSYFLLSAHLFPNPTVAQGVQVFFLLFVLAVVVSSIAGGLLSDRLQRRKGFVIGASLTTVVGLLLMALFPFWEIVLLAAVVLGVGVGTYLSIDLALASQLPTVRDRGKDLGIMNAAIFLPMLIAPAIAGIAVNVFHSYQAMFLMLGMATACSAFLIVPVKRVR